MSIGDNFEVDWTAMEIRWVGKAKRRYGYRHFHHWMQHRLAPGRRAGRGLPSSSWPDGEEDHRIDAARAVYERRRAGQP